MYYMMIEKLTAEEREQQSLHNIKQMLEDQEINLSVEEFIKIYSSNRAIKSKATNVWRSCNKSQLQLKGNRKYLVDILSDSLSFIKPHPKTRKSQLIASAKYDQTHTKQYTLKLNTKTDKDVIDYLNQCKNKQGVIKQLIREEIKEGK